MVSCVKPFFKARDGLNKIWSSTSSRSFFQLKQFTSLDVETKEAITETATTAKIIEENFCKWFDDSLEEVPTPRELDIIGVLPPFLSGTLIKNGAAAFSELGNPTDKKKVRRYTHLFDGLAKLTKYEILDGKVTFSTKFLESYMYKEIVLKRSSIPPTVSSGPTSPPLSLFEQIRAAFFGGSFDNVPVNVAQIGDGDESAHFVGITDAPILVEFDLHTLETKGALKTSGGITSHGGSLLFSTAHPCYDRRERGAIYNYFLEVQTFDLPSLPWARKKKKKTNVAHMVKTDANLKRTVVGSLELGQGVIPYIHDFSLTENFIILFEYPLRLQMSKLVSDKGFFQVMDWLGDQGVNTRIHIFERSPSNSSDGARPPVCTLEAPPMFSYHHVNAFEEEYQGQRQIVVDVSGYDTPDIATSQHAFVYLPNMKDPALRAKQVHDARCYRFRLPAPSSSLTESSSAALFVRPTILPFLDGQGRSYTAEMTRVDDERKGSRCRYSYGTTGFAGSSEDPSRGGFLQWAIVKRDHDLAEALASDSSRSAVTAWVWRDAGCFPSEPVFVRDPEGDGEDSGVLLSEVYDALRAESFLLVLDARTMRELARAYIGQIRPFPFHGKFIPSQQPSRAI